MFPEPEIQIIIHTFVSSRLDNSNSLFICLSQSSLDCLKLVQNAAARLLTKSSRRKTHITSILSALHRLSIKFKNHFKVLVLTYRPMHCHAPAYISDLLHPYITNRSLGSSGQGSLVVPRARLKLKGDPSFEVTALTLWKALPIDFYGFC